LPKKRLGHERKVLIKGQPQSDTVPERNMPLCQDSQDRFGNVQQTDNFSDLKTQIQTAEILPLAEPVNLGSFSTRDDEKSNRKSISKVKAASIHDKDNSLCVEKPDRNVDLIAPSMLESEFLLGQRNGYHSPENHQTIEKNPGVKG
jgi:hypothetical protein